MTLTPLNRFAPGLLALALAAVAPASPARAQSAAVVAQAPALLSVGLDDDYWDAIKDYNENLREAREEYFEDLRDAERRSFRRYRRGYLPPAVPYGYGYGPVYPRRYVVPAPVVPYYPPVPYYGGGYGYYPGGGVNIRFGPFRSFSAYW